RPSEAELRELAAKLGSEVSASVFGSDLKTELAEDNEIRDEQLLQAWRRLSLERQTTIIDEMRAKASSKDDTDLVAKERFAQLFANQHFRGLSLELWEKEKRHILSTDSPLLILVDEDFRKED